MHDLSISLFLTNIIDYQQQVSIMLVTKRSAGVCKCVTFTPLPSATPHSGFAKQRRQHQNRGISCFKERTYNVFPKVLKKHASIMTTNE